MTPDQKHFATMLAAAIKEIVPTVTSLTPAAGDRISAVSEDFLKKHMLPLGIGLLSGSIHDLHVKKGFYVEDRSVSHLMGLVMTELAEIVEDDRKFESDRKSEKIPEFTKEEEEVADAIIRLLDFAGHRMLRIGAAIVAKHEYNATRPPLHGKRY